MDKKHFEEKLSEYAEWKHEELPYVIKKLKCAPCVCDDCGLICENGRHVDAKQYQTPLAHWRRICKTCKKYQLPDGTWSSNAGGSACIWTAYLKNQKLNEEIKKD